MKKKQQEKISKETHHSNLTKTGNSERDKKRSNSPVKHVQQSEQHKQILTKPATINKQGSLNQQKAKVQKQASIKKQQQIKKSESKIKPGESAPKTNIDSEKKVQIQYKPIPSQEVEIIIDKQTLLPTDPNMVLVHDLESFVVKDQKVIQYYCNEASDNLRFIIRPLSISLLKNVESTKQQLQVVLLTQNLQKYEEVSLSLGYQFLHVWFVELLYSLHPRKSKLPFFIKISKSNLFIQQTSFSPMVAQRQTNYNWQNPFKIVLRESVAQQKQFFQQMITLNFQFSKIKSFEDLQKFYKEHQFGSDVDQMFSVTNLASKINEITENCIKLSVKIAKPTIQDILDNQSMKWVIKQIKIDDKLKPYVYYQATSCNFEPSIFWQKMKLNEKDEKQLLIIQTNSKPKKFIGFYSTLWKSASENAKQVLPAYIIDSSETSMLMNISLKTVHHLHDSKHALTTSSQVLICIGKCDIIASAYNITNLCYFPVSYGADADHMCATADSLCGGKNFQLKDIYTIRFAQDSQIK